MAILSGMGRKFRRINHVTPDKLRLNLLLLNQTVTSKLSSGGAVFIRTQELVDVTVRVRIRK